MRGRSPRRSRPVSPTKGFEGANDPNIDASLPLDAQEYIFRSRSKSPGLGSISVADIDPEAVRAALRDFVQQLATSEKDRDDALAQARSLSIQLKEMEEDRDRIEAR